MSAHLHLSLAHVQINVNLKTNANFFVAEYICYKKNDRKKQNIKFKFHGLHSSDGIKKK